KDQRTAQLARVMVRRENGRLSRTLVNRLWAKLLGRGLVEPVDDMEKSAWDNDLLDFLAEDFVTHGFDLKHTMELIVTSRAYQSRSVENPGTKDVYVFKGPLARRITAEQFADTITSLTADFARMPATLD